MKIRTILRITSAAVLITTGARAATSIDAVNNEAYGANIGWMDWQGDGANGAIIGNYVCSGYIYSANCGWINLGGGTPTNGVYYQNIATNDFGVNNAGVAVPGYFELRGYAYGANIGWINFENTGGAAVNMITGQLTGYAWSANCGWISLATAYAYVQTDWLYPGPLSTNGLPIPWLLANFGTTNINPNSDPNNTGLTVAQDYAGGLAPSSAGSTFDITAKTFGAGGATAAITWQSESNRLYTIQSTTNLAATNWTDSGLGLIPGSLAATTTTNFTATAAADRFYRVQAIVPLHQ